MNLVTQAQRWYQQASPSKRRNTIIWGGCAVALGLVVAVSQFQPDRPKKLDDRLDVKVVAPPKRNVDLESIAGQLTALQRQLQDVTSKQASDQARNETSLKQLKDNVTDVAAGKLGDANLKKQLDQAIEHQIEAIWDKKKEAAERAGGGQPIAGGGTGGGSGGQLGFPELPVVSQPPAAGTDSAPPASRLRLSDERSQGGVDGATADGAGGQGAGGGTKHAAGVPPLGKPNAPSADIRGQSGGVASPTWLPAGSILTGTNLTGMDVPVSQASQKHPTPTLIRIKHEAILPNYYTADVSECFVLASGHGELSTERAKLRTERITCVRNDGGVVEASLDGYIVGEDGKAGLRGKLVSREGAAIARTVASGWLAAFGRGLGAAFALQNSGNSLSIGRSAVDQGGITLRGGRSPTEAIQGAALSGAGQGLGDAFEKIADYYMDLAKEAVPTIEVEPARKITIVLVRGTSIKFNKS
ncbi:TraB/VirB10 family protein [Cupriavidus malaysiensis]|uniref:Conjugal transfer protein TraB n=1 Tax=Cupriavidus malaysiensis TaxID=367825 RepID=A0ABM6FGV7_9BURK|nr:TraB/VirB10 family protein [Cupriavidus malaysiensis]AOZ11199.1 hypothetical protein BKK80_35185 [Cupriavidus malaysiensis]